MAVKRLPLTRMLLDRRDEIITEFGRLKKTLVDRQEQHSLIRAESYNNAVEDCIRVLKDLL